MIAPIDSVRYAVRTATALILCTLSYPALAQTYASSDPLPDAPAVQPAAPPIESSTAQVTGTLTDTQGAVVPGATVILTPYGKIGDRTGTSGSDGTFTFTGLLPNQYHLTIEAPGLDVYTSPEFTLRAGTSFTVPTIELKISASTTVDVVASNEQIALAQIHEQEKQRVLGVFQNFYTSYIWDAQPMPAKQKLRLSLRALVDPPQFLIVAGLAGAEQHNGTYPGYGPGIEGYGKRYGAAFADATSARLIGSGILPALLHQDPRYFYQGSGSVPSRTLHAVAFTFTARGDNGKTQPNYSHLLGALAAAGIANAYHPEGSRGVGDTFQTFGITTFGNIIGNVFREFVLRHIETIPTYATGKH